MLRRVPRTLRAAVLVTVLLAVVASIAQSWMSGTPGAAGYVQTAWGPLGPADRDLLTKVRLASLWEAPSGQQATTQASAAAVQQVGQNIHTEHVELDEAVLETAGQLGVLLPSSPNAQQMAWMQELTGLRGAAYDQRFVQILRQAHGTILPLIAEVRAGTRNELMRQFATTGNEYVSRHIGYLESTGLVDYTDLPEPPSPGLMSLERGPADLVVPGLVVIAALLAAGGLLTAVRRRPKPAPFPLSPAEPPVTGRALAQIALPGPRRAEATESGAYRITDTRGITDGRGRADSGGTGPFPRARGTGPLPRVPAGRHSTRR